jgi:hypothetical protein
MLVCTEAGAVVGETESRPLVVRQHADRRSPVAAGTPALLGEVLEGFAASRRAARSRDRTASQ